MRLKDMIQHPFEDPAGIFSLRQSVSHQEQLFMRNLLNENDFQAAHELALKADSWIWDETTTANPQLGIGFMGAFYGQERADAAQIYTNAVELLRQNQYEGDIPDVTETSGFTRLRQMEPGLSDQQYMISEMIVAKELVTGALAQAGKKVEDVDLFLAATSIPIHPDFFDDWKRAAGIPADVPAVPFCMACNSSGRAIAEVLSGNMDETLRASNPEFAKGKAATIVLLALDDANRRSNEGADPWSPQLFSTGAGAVVWQYHPESPSSMKLISHVSRSVEEGTEFLKVVRTFDSWTPEQQNRTFLAKFLKEPTPEEGFMYMRPEAGVSFKNHALALAQDTLQEYQQKGFSPDRIRKVVVHHPSRPIFDKLKKALLKNGFTDEQIQWVINEGNVPVATIPFAFGRQLEDLQPHDHVMFLSFGAGGEYTCFIAEMGAVTP